MSAALHTLVGVGQKRAAEFAAIGITTLRQLLDYFPRDYRLEHAEGSIDKLQRDQIETVRGTVVACDYIPARPRPRFEATLEDSTGKLALSWFNGAYLRRRITPGMLIRVRGKVGFFRNFPQMVNPKWETVADDPVPVAAEQFRPIYAASARLSSDTIASVIQDNLEAGLGEIEEWFDTKIVEKRELISRRQAYRLIHAPASASDASHARRRLIYDELVLLQIGLALSKRLREKGISAPLVRIDRTLDARIRSRFPFKLTAGQQHAVFQIVKDLHSGTPMNRLLQGDVGSGKTVVALYGMLACVANKMQAVLLAPTEVLADQHALTLQRFLEGSAVRVDLFTSRTRRGAAGATLATALAEGKTSIAVGTQALLEKDVQFANLGLVVVDEQHRLGVRQRAILKSKGYQPHYLIMTATPIPRTLALSSVADFDLSVIDELPPGRQPVETKWLRAPKAHLAHDFIWKQIGAGRQAYIVLPQIDDSEIDDAKSVTTEYQRLSEGPLKGLRLGMLHGRLAPAEKQAVMQRFRDGALDVLVSTTVIEVGVDVPNATVMLIEQADRFGLSQLHQLRGRVGRGSEQSYCFLISDATSDDAMERLGAMTQFSSGFDIAEADLRQRGPGDFFGTRQHGLPPLKLADLSREIEMLSLARDDALQLLAGDPELRAPLHQPLRHALRKQFGDALDLVGI